MNLCYLFYHFSRESRTVNCSKLQNTPLLFFSVTQIEDWETTITAAGFFQAIPKLGATRNLIAVAGITATFPCADRAELGKTLANDRFPFHS